MCHCYQPKTRKYCSSCVTFISVLIGILGIIIFAIGAMQTGSIDPDLQKAKVNLLHEESKYAMPVIVIGLCTTLTALLGCFSVRYKNPFFAVPFAFVTFTIGISFIIFGAVSIGSGRLLSPESFRETVCENSKDFQQAYAEAVDQVMCSDICPCDEGQSKYNEELWTAYGAKVLAPYNRTGKPETNNGASVALVWQKHAFTTYQDCYEKVLKPQNFG